MNTLEMMENLNNKLLNCKIFRVVVKDLLKRKSLYGIGIIKDVKRIKCVTYMYQLHTISVIVELQTCINKIFKRGVF